jgi:hypothetical protein
MKKFTLSLLLLLSILVTPVHANGWFPSLNSKGDVVSGAGVIVLNGRQVAAPGWGPKWLDDDRIVFSGGPNEEKSVILNVRTGVREELIPGYNQIAAGGGMWLGLWQGNPLALRRYEGADLKMEIVDAGKPTVAPNGRWGYVTPYHAEEKRFMADGRVVGTGVIMDAALTETAAVYSVHLGRGHERAVFLATSTETRRVEVFNWEGPTACDGAGATWIMSTTQNGLAFRQAGSAVGRYWRGEYFNPTCRYINGVFRLASSSGAGELQVMDVNPADVAGLVRFSEIRDCVNCDVPPPVLIPPVDPRPKPPVLTQTFRMAADVQETVRAVFQKVAHLHRGTDEERREGTRIIVEQVVFSHPNQGWGWKASGPNSPPSKDAIARLVNGRLYYMDLINGATRELVDLNGEMGDITGQHFITVNGVNHLGSVPPPVITPPPADGTHPYERDDDERDECNKLINGMQCDRKRSDPIHQTGSTPPPVVIPPPTNTCDGWIQSLTACQVEVVQQRDANDIAQRELQRLRDAQQRDQVEIERLKQELAKPVTCKVKAPSWLRVGCEVIR